MTSSVLPLGFTGNGDHPRKPTMLMSTPRLGGSATGFVRKSSLQDDPFPINPERRNSHGNPDKSTTVNTTNVVNQQQQPSDNNKLNKSNSNNRLKKKTLLDQHLNWYYEYQSTIDSTIDTTVNTSTTDGDGTATVPLPGSPSTKGLNSSTTLPPTTPDVNVVKGSYQDFVHFNRERGTTKFFQLLLFFFTIGIFPIFLHNLISISSPTSPLNEHGVPDFEFIWGVVLLINVTAIVTCGWSAIVYSKRSSAFLSVLVGRLFGRLFPSQWFPNLSSSNLLAQSHLSPRDDFNHVAPATAQQPLPVQQRIEISVFREISGSTHHEAPPQDTGTRPNSARSNIGELSPRLSNHRGIGSTPSQRGGPFSIVPSQSFKDLAVPAKKKPSLSKITSILKTKNNSKIKPSPDKEFQMLPRTLSTNSSHIPSENLERVKFANTLKLITFLLFQLLMLLLFICHSTYECSIDEGILENNNILISPFGVDYCESPNTFVIIGSLVLFVFPYLLFVSIPDISIQWVWCTIWVSFAVIIAITINLAVYHSWLTIMIILSLVICLIIDTQVYKVQMFLIANKLGGILEEKELSAIENHAQEMRHMIANVAHDLKTVSCIVA